MALGSTLPLTEMSTRRISWGQIQPMLKADNLTTSPYLVMKSGNLNFLEPSWPLQNSNGTALSLLLPTLPLLIKFGISLPRFKLSPLMSEKASQNYILQLASGPRIKRTASTIIIIKSFYSLWRIGHPLRTSRHCDLQLSP